MTGAESNLLAIGPILGFGERRGVITRLDRNLLLSTQLSSTKLLSTVSICPGLLHQSYHHFCLISSLFAKSTSSTTSAGTVLAILPQRREIRLLKVFLKEKSPREHLVNHPLWKAKDSNSPPGGFPSSRIVSPFNDPDSQTILACEVVDGVWLSKCRGEYLALSYAAGDPANTARILVDGTIFNAFAQLVHAIQCAVRFHERSGCHQDNYLFLWVDQICINQSDPEERAHQVMMMRDIYDHSRITLVCLSTGEEKRKANAWDTTQYSGLDWFTKVEHFTSIFDFFWDKCLEDEPIYSSLESFLVFLRCPWWTRSWVYQEFVCSPEVHFVFGEDDAPWEKISACLTSSDVGSWYDEWTSRLSSKAHRNLIRDKQRARDEKQKQEHAEHAVSARDRNQPRSRPPEQLHIKVEKNLDALAKNLNAPDVQRSMNTVVAMLDGRSKQGSQGDLRMILRHARNFQASDTRDKIYAFVGLAQGGYGFQPSYSHENTAVHVHSDAARRILEHDGDLTYILEQAFVGRRDLGFFLPSWVPDWNCHEDRSVLLELEQHANRLNGGIDAPRAIVTSEDSGDKKPAVEFHGNDNAKFGLRVLGRRIMALRRECKVISGSLRHYEIDSDVVVFAPTTARPKDEVWSLLGCKWPVLLRHEEEEKYCFGGFAVVGGVDYKGASEEAADQVLLI